MSMSEGPEPASWVVVNTHVHREQVAVENLQRQQFRAYCPMIRRQVRHARRTHEVLRPLFPGYVFVQLDPAGPSWRPILSTIGVRRMVQFGEALGRLPPSFIEGLKAREQDGAIVQPEPAFEVGQQIRLSGGPLDGLIARIVQMSEKDRLVVLMEMLNQPVRVTVPSASVTALDGD